MFLIIFTGCFKKQLWKKDGGLLCLDKEYAKLGNPGAEWLGRIPHER